MLWTGFYYPHLFSLCIPLFPRYLVSRFKDILLYMYNTRIIKNSHLLACDSLWLHYYYVFKFRLHLMHCVVSSRSHQWIFYPLPSWVLNCLSFQSASCLSNSLISSILFICNFFLCFYKEIMQISIVTLFSSSFFWYFSHNRICFKSEFWIILYCLLADLIIPVFPSCHFLSSCHHFINR